MCNHIIDAVQSHFCNNRVWQTLPSQVQPSNFHFALQVQLPSLGVYKLSIEHLTRDGLEETTTSWALVAQRERQ